MIDENKKVVIDKETQKPIIGDLNLDDNNFDYAKQLQEFHKKREELLEKSRLLQSEDNEVEKQKIQNKLDKINELESESIKNGFCGHMLEKINEIIIQYKNVYIVMEDLDIEQNQEDEGNTNKEKNLEKLLGATAYQTVEDAIISKFKYYQTKNYQFNGSQLVPNIERIRDLRNLNDSQKLERNKYGRIKFYKSKAQIGNLLFVDDFLTSQMCPECGFCICEENTKERAKNFGNPITYEKVKKSSIRFDSETENLYINNKEYLLKHFSEIREKYQKKIISQDVETIENALKPRVKSQRICKNYFIEKDSFFCPACGKNTEEKNFIEPLKSGDHIASFNIAKRGLEFIIKKTEEK